MPPHQTPQPVRRAREGHHTTPYDQRHPRASLHPKHAWHYHIYLARSAKYDPSTLNVCDLEIPTLRTFRRTAYTV